MKLLSRAIALLLAALPLTAAAEPVNKECRLCLGVVSDLAIIPTTPLPLLIETTEGDFDSVAAHLGTLSAEQRNQTSIALRTDLPPEATLTDVDTVIDRILAWSRTSKPFDGFGIEFTGASPELRGYALKRLAVTIEGEGIARRILLPVPDIATLETLYTTGSQAYFDAIVVRDDVPTFAGWLVEHDPAKRIEAIVTPSATNALHSAAAALAGGAQVAYIRAATNGAADSIARVNGELGGDFAYDSSSRIELLDASGAKREGTAYAFVRGEDLRTIIFPPGTAEGAYIISFPSDEGMNPRLVDATGAKKITDAGKKNRRLLIGMQPRGEAFAITVDRPAYEDPNVTKESVDVATVRTISVEEIIRNHQAYDSFQDSIEPRYIARNETKLRFGIGGGERIEATLAGDHFFDPEGTNDWMWRDLFINGVRWKYGRIPELPLVQPEKVTQLPLDIHLTNDYRYTLAGDAKIGGFDVWEVRFEPPPKAASELPLYRGTVWIEKKSWARVRIRMLQMNLSGEVLSNEEQVDFVAFDRSSKQLLTPLDTVARDSKSIYWLPSRVSAQQVLSTAGRTTAIERATDFSNFRVDPDNYEERLADAWASDTRMVRDTEKGLRYLDPAPGGQRVVKDSFDTSRLFLVGGIHHDAGLDIPVAPLGGIDYFNFNVADKGWQTNVFFAGVILAANLTNPSWRGTRTNIGGDLFGLAIPFENSMYRNGEEVPEEGVKTLPLVLAGRIGHPFADFGKIDLSVGVNYRSYQRGEETAADFIIPQDGLEIVPGIDVSYERRGYNLALAYEQGFRSGWEPWGNFAEYDQNQENFTRFKGTLGKSFYLPKFQRIGMEVNYLDGRNLDRFSKYELGFFGSQRVRGFSSGSVRAEKGILGHLSYGFVISDQLRLEAFYDHALLDDALAGYAREPFQGVGLAGQIVGPFATIMRLDIGKSIGRNRDDDFVADIVFLKIFG